MGYSGKNSKQISNNLIGNIFMRLPKKLIILLGFCFVAACQSAPPPVIVPPPVIIPPPVVIPPVPVPPLNAAVGLTIPPIDVDGTRSSPNKNLNSEETIWHLRSSYNVSALLCQGTSWGQIATNYNAFINKHERRLRTSNRAIEDQFQKQNRGEAGRRDRDTHITALYNYFALPPVKNRFCNSMLLHSNEMAALSSEDILLYAQVRLPEIDAIFIDFYDSYEAYERALADWNAAYGQPASTFGPSNFLQAEDTATVFDEVVSDEIVSDEIVFVPGTTIGSDDNASGPTSPN